MADMRPTPMAAVVLPRPNESLTSWIDRMAASFGVTTGEALRGLGLLPRGSQRIPLLGVVLAAENEAQLSITTGVSPDALRRTLLSRFDGSAIDLAGLRSGVSPGQIALREWALFWGTRVCPQCLGEAGGAWNVWWKLGLAVACPVHSVVLADACPACDTAMRRSMLGRGPATLSTVPRPTVCGQRVGPTWCDFDLTRTPCVPSDERLEQAQARISAQIEAADRSWIVALREGVALVRRLASADDLGPAPHSAAAAFAHEVDERDRDRCQGEAAPCYTTLPASVAALAAVLPTAVDLVDTADPQESVGWLVDIAGRAGFESWRYLPDSLGLSSIVAERWRVAVRPYVSFSGVGRRCATGAGIFSRHVPQACSYERWQAVSTNVPGTGHETGRTFFALAAVVAIEGGSWAYASERLDLGRGDGERISDVVSRRVIDPDQFWRDVADFVRDLALGAVDFRRERRRLAGLAEIDEEWLSDACQRLGVLRGFKVRRRYAAGWVWCQLTQGLFCNSPAWAAAREGGASTDALREGYRRFGRTITQGLAAELLEAARSGAWNQLSHPIDMV